MDKFLLKGKRPAPDSNAAGTSSPVRPRQDLASNIGTTPPPPAEINLDALPHDPADQKRVGQYTKDPQKQDEIRRIYLNRGPYRPQEGFKYPQKTIAGAERRFNPKWFKDYHWLEYSDKVHKAFCLCCYLFRDCIDGQGGNDAFVVKGFSCWNQKQRLDTHEGEVNSFHNVAVKRCDALMNQNRSIKVALDKQTDITKKQNRIRLNTFVESVRYLLHQGLAFRGNDESEDSKNKGNFRELVQTLANQNEDVRKVLLQNAPQNCKWVCPDIQKELVSYFAKVNNNHHYSLLYIYFMQFILL